MLCTYFHVNAQGNCPWHVKMEKHDATCVGGGGVTFTLYDDNNNPIELTTEEIEGVLYAVPTDPSISLSRIRFYYKEEFDTIKRYSPNPDFSIPNAGKYIVGVSAQCVREGSGSEALMALDTFFTQVNILNLYNSPIVEFLNHTATNSTDLGYRPSNPCAPTGRIQMNISGGSFPYYIKIYNLDTQDTVRFDTIREPQYNGQDITRYDYEDYYTFDSLPAGNYRFFFTDGCGYTKNAPDFTFEIKEIQIPEMTYIHFSKGSTEYNIFRFYSMQFSAGDIKDYLYDDYEDILQYRVIYGSLYTSEWKAFPVQNLHWNDEDLFFNYNDYTTWSDYLNDTANITRLCDLDGQSVTFQLRTKNCGDETIKSFSTGAFHPHIYVWNPINQEILDYNGVYYDSCGYHIPHVHNSITSIYGETGSDWHSLNDNYSYYNYSIPYGISSWSFTDVESGQIIKSGTTDQMNNYSWEISRSELENFYGEIADTVFWKRLRFDVVDGQGCSYSSGETLVELIDKTQSHDNNFSMSDNHDYKNHSDPVQCCSSQNYVRVYEYVEDYSNVICNPIPRRYQQLRDGAKYKLVESPRNNKYNFTATYNFDSDSWDIVKDTYSNNAEIVPYLSEDNNHYYWGLELRDYCLPQGKYSFVYYNGCNDSTTINTYIWGTEEKITFEQPVIEVEQSCGKLAFKVTDGYVKLQRVGTDTGNPLQPERIEDEDVSDTRFRIVSGPVGGYDDAFFTHNETVYLSKIGDYTLRMYSPNYRYYCNEEKYYDTIITYSGGSISFESTMAYVCDADSTVGFFFCDVKQGTAPFTYTLYDSEENGNAVIEQVNSENKSHGFTFIPGVHVGEVLSMGVMDACNNTFTFPVEVKDFISSDFAWFDGKYETKELCEGTMIDVYVSTTNDYFTYHWTGPNGFDTITPRAQIIIARGSEPGYYTVELGNTGCSRTLKDTVTLNVQQAPKVRMEYSESNICPGKTVTLMFTPEQGVGTITYTIGRSVNSIDTFYTFSTELHETTTIQYTAISDAIFWINDVTDELCNYTIPEDTVVISLRNAATACDVTVSSPQVCFDATAELTASSSTMVKPYTIRWYDNPYQQNVLKTDVIEEGMSDASFTTGKLQADSTLYVTIQDATHCETYTGTVNQWMNMDNGTTPLTCGQSIRLFDDGGSNGNYLSGKYYKHTFTSTDGNLITLSFNSFNTQLNGDVMRVYTGAEVLQDSLLALISGSNLPESLTSNGTSMTIVFVSNSATEAEGWDALVSCSALPAQANIKVLEDLSVTLSISPEMPARYGQSYTLTAVANGGQGSRYEFTWHITDKDYNEIQSSSHELASNTDIYNLNTLT
ncbi:MAG: hypothetical protein CW341_10545, partial [Bacteroidetes bacterium]|nr:hypothetical protein [Bacteroidota bacterium]